MQINMAVEPLDREALAACVGRNMDAVTLTSLIASSAYLDQSDGVTPSLDDVNDTAKQFVEMEPWAGATLETARDMFAAIANLPEQPPVPPETFLLLIWPITAWLLSAFGPEEQLWYQYLDAILYRIEN